MALLIFVDDSKCKMPTADGARQWYGYGGLALQDKHLPTLDRKFEELKTIYGFPSRLPRFSKLSSIENYCEVKYNPTRSIWMHSNLIEERRESFFKETLELVQSLSGTFIFSYYDESSDLCGESSAKSRALENLYERVNAIATDQDSSIGIVVCDIEGSRTQAQQLVTKATGIARLGTWFQRDLKTHLYPVLLMGDSHVHTGLQIVDVAVGSLSNMLRSESVYAPPIWATVMKSLYKRSGTVRGWGVKMRSKDAGRVYNLLGL